MTKQRTARQARRHRGVKVLLLKDGRHVARWTDPLTGRQQQQSLDALGLSSDPVRRSWAQEKSKQVASLRQAVALGTVAPTRASLDDAIAAYLETQAHPPTRQNKAVVLDHLREWLGARAPSLADLSPHYVLGWRDALVRADDGRMPSTKNRYLAAARTFLRWAVKRGRAPLLNSDAIRNGCEPMPQPGWEPDCLRPAQARAVLSAALEHDRRPGVPQRVAALVGVLLLSGMRISEAVNLRWHEVDFAGRAICLPAARTKTRRARTIGWAESPALGAILEVLRPEKPAPDARVFPTMTGPSWQAAAMRMAGKHGSPTITAHLLRRTCGTVLACAPGIYSGAAIYLAAARQGHSVKVAEKHYLGQLRDLPATARTIEDALGVADLVAAIAAAEVRR
jgi:integrase